MNSGVLSHVVWDVCYGSSTKPSHRRLGLHFRTQVKALCEVDKGACSSGGALISLVMAQKSLSCSLMFWNFNSNCGPVRGWQVSSAFFRYHREASLIRARLIPAARTVSRLRTEHSANERTLRGTCRTSLRRFLSEVCPSFPHGTLYFALSHQS